MKYFQDCAAGRKWLILCSEATEIEVHRFAELKAQAALKMCAQDELCWRYVPDAWIKDKARIDRRFLWVILATIRPDFTKHVLENAYNKRWALTNQDGAKEDF